MKVKELAYHRKFNLGNYETEDIGLTVEIDELMDLKEQFRVVKQIVFDFHKTPVDERIEKAAQQIGKNPYEKKENSEK